MIRGEVPAIVAPETGVVGAGAIMLHRGMTDAHDGVDPVALTRWLAAEVPRVELGDGPVAVERISGGHSNLTFRVTDARGTPYALRRPTWAGSGAS
jgi:aminoglycoside phosphotransferase (APT) family kinase protein